MISRGFKYSCSGGLNRTSIAMGYEPWGEPIPSPRCANIAII